jgi:short-subunit dehydrogenase
MERAGLITGASSGIGWELAKIHASMGNHVVLVARRAEKLEQLAQEIHQTHGVKTWVIEADLSTVEGVNKVIESTQREGIFVNYLFNNAGFGGWGKFADRSAESDAKMIDVNVSALTRLMHAYLPSMIEQNEGRILNTASTAGFIPGPLQATYFATKAFELRKTPITVTALCPGPVKTEFDVMAGMGDSSMFDNGADAYSTAMKGYQAMMKGKRIKISEFSFTLLIKVFGPFIPDSMVMKIVEKMQSK